MAYKEIYLGPDWKKPLPIAQKPTGEYTVADQSRAWGVPEEQLATDDPSDSVAPDTAIHVQ